MIRDGFVALVFAAGASGVASAQSPDALPDAGIDAVAADAGGSSDASPQDGRAPDPVEPRSEPRSGQPLIAVDAASEPATGNRALGPCSARGICLYVEPSVFVALGSYSPVPRYLDGYIASNVGSVLHRFGVGVLLAPRSTSGVRLRLGVTGSASDLAWSGSSHTPKFGIGIEAELDHPIARRWRLGPRIGGETAGDVGMISVGARLHARDAIWFGVEVFRLTTPSTSMTTPRCSDYVVPGCATSTTGVMAGIGLEGRTGVYGGVIEVAAGSLAALLTAAIVGAAIR